MGADEHEHNTDNESELTPPEDTGSPETGDVAEAETPQDVVAADAGDAADAEEPQAPDAPDAVEAPDAPEAPDVVEASDAPEAPAPDAVEAPDAPEAPDAVEAPEAPAPDAVEAPVAEAVEAPVPDAVDAVVPDVPPTPDAETVPVPPMPDAPTVPLPPDAAAQIDAFAASGAANVAAPVPPATWSSPALAQPGVPVAGVPLPPAPGAPLPPVAVPAATRPLPAWLNGRSLVSAALAAAIGLGFAVVASVIVMLLTLLFGLISGPVSAGPLTGSDSGSISDLVEVGGTPFAMLAWLTSLGLFGQLTAGYEMSGFGGAATIQLFTSFVAVIVLIAGLIGAAWWSYRDERRSRTSTRAGLWALAGATGLAGGILGLLLSLLGFATMSVNMGFASVALSVSSLTAASFFGPFVVFGLAAVFGRWLARGVAHRHFGQALWHAPSRFRWGTRDLYDYVAVLTLIFVPVSLVASFVMGNGVAALWPIAVGQFTVAAVTIGHLGAYSANGASPGAPAGGSTLSLFSVDNALVWILPIIGLVAVLAAGILIARRRARQPVPIQRAWVLPVLVFGASLVIGLALGGGYMIGSGQMLSVGGGLSLLVGPAFWTYLIAAVWGAAVEATARFIAPSLMATWPRLAGLRVAGDGVAGFAPAPAGMPIPAAAYPPAPAPGAAYPPAPAPGAAYPPAPAPGAAYPAAPAPGAEYQAAPTPGAEYAAAPTPGAEYVAAPAPGVAFSGAPTPDAPFAAAGYPGAATPDAAVPGAPVPGAPIPGAPVPGAPDATGAVGSTLAAPPPPAKPLSPAAKRGLLIGGIAAAALLVLGVAGAIVVSVLQNTTFSPKGDVQAYLDDIAAGNFASASAASGVSSGTGLLGADHVELDEAITDIRVGEPKGEGETRTVEVTFSLSGERMSGFVTLVSAGKQYVFFDDWQVSEGLEVPVYPFISGPVDSLTVGGVDVAVGEDQDELMAYPGVYAVESNASQWVSVEAEPLVVSTSGGELSVEAVPSDAFADEVKKQVKALLDKCAKSKEADPKGCPFSLYAFSETRNIAWKITEYPEIELYGFDGFTGQDGEATATYEVQDWLDESVWESETETDAIYVSGEIEISGDSVKVTLR